MLIDSTSIISRLISSHHNGISILWQSRLASRCRLNELQQVYITRNEIAFYEEKNESKRTFPERLY
jgi:hypothetical protein